LALTAELLLRQGRASRVLILDLDVHQVSWRQVQEGGQAGRRVSD